jgi:hypothetical protein
MLSQSGPMLPGSLIRAGLAQAQALREVQMSFRRLRHPACMSLALAASAVAWGAVAGETVAAGPGAAPLPTGGMLAHAQDSTSGKPKRKSRTRKPTPCGPGASLPDCPASGKSSGAGLSRSA